MPPVLWIQKQDIGPSARSGFGIASDSGRNRVVLFGGDPSGLPLSDTWEWDGSLWTQVADTGPSPRRGTAMAYSAAEAGTVLFGGQYGAVLLGETWTFDGTDWIQVADTGPSARTGHAMAYDLARDRLVLFGGYLGPMIGDTWEWDGSAWAQVQDAGPAARHGHVLAYDGASERVVLFGGADATGAGLGDTWTWDGSNWTEAADTGPAGRVGAAIADGGSVLLFGGLNSLDPSVPATDRVVYGDTWRWSNGSWVQVQDIGPGPRWGHGMAFRPNAGRSVLFGGSTAFGGGAAALRADTWEVPDQAASPNPIVGGQPAGGVEVANVYVATNFYVAGQPVIVHVDLTGPAVAGSSLTIDVVPAQGPTGPVNPNVGGWAIPAVGFSGGETSTQFTLVPDGSVPLYGAYAVVVQLAPVAVPKYATFQLM